MNKNSNLNDRSGENFSFVPDSHFKRYSILKRILDYIFAFLALIISSVPMLIIAALIKLDSKGPAVFKQKRVGKDGKIFNCFKFRSMYVTAPSSCATNELDSADKFITPIGKILRKTSLDELPQLINILKGEMSFIGPRPLIPEETEVHEARKATGVYNLCPGISGYAQVNGRDFLSNTEKAALDKYYLEHFGFITDVKILFDTIINVLGAKNIHEGKIKNAPQQEQVIDCVAEKEPLQ